MDGVLLVDKPAGATSHDVVAQARRRFGIKRIGHAGTLDPFATGLLIVLVGRATRAQRFFMAQDKGYLTTARFGWTSTTGDPEGELVETGRVPARPLVLPTGVLRQRPPAYSAVKVGGRRAYELARAGEEVELAEREVTVSRFEEVAEGRFAIACSSGTYVRTLVSELGDAYCTELRRTSIGPFTVDEVSDELLPLADALGRILPVERLSGALAQRLAVGQTIPFEVGDRPVVLCVDDDGPLALVEEREPGFARPVVGFRGT